MKVIVYIPRPGSALASAIEPGSAIIPIGNPRQDGVRAICWERKPFAERLPATFADLSERAYKRSRDHRNDLRKLVCADDLVAVAQFETTTGLLEVEHESEAEALADWLGTSSLDPVELATTRGVVVQMVRDSVREHGDRLRPEESRRAATATGYGRSRGFYGR